MSSWNFYFWKHQTINYHNLNSWKIRLVDSEHFFTTQKLIFEEQVKFLLQKAFVFWKNMIDVLLFYFLIILSWNSF